MPPVVESGRARPLAAAPPALVAAAARPEADVLADVAAVAEAHRPEGGYGDTHWHAGRRAVFWNHADWTTNDEASAAEEAFRAIDGVSEYDSDAEAGPPSGYEQVWPPVDAEAAAVARHYRDLAYVDLAVAQIQAEQTVDADALLAALPNLPEIPGLDPGILRAALEAVAQSHRATVESTVALIAAAVRDRGETNGDVLAARAIDALRAHASRPETPPPHVTVNVPEQNVSLSAPAPVVNVTVPEQAAPVVNVAAAEAPVVNVTVPDLVAAAPAPVIVNMPEQPAPVVHVEAPQIDVHVPSQKPRRVRVEFDGQGNKSYVQEDTDDD